MTGECTVTMAVNGFEAVKVVNNNLQKTPKEFFDLVLLDLGMPIMDGYEACSKICSIFSQEKVFSFVEPMLGSNHHESSSALREQHRHCCPLLISCSANEIS